ncbi:MAG: hypothetical protein ACM3WS_03575 [Bacillota bacterium]
MNFDQRNEYGFPVIVKVQRAHRIAAEARARNHPPCGCLPCRLKELEETAVPMINNWSKEK